MQNTEDSTVSSHNIKKIIGPASSQQVSQLIRCSQRPIHFQNMIDCWPSRKWTIENFATRFKDLYTRFRICSRNPAQQLTANILVETEDTKMVETEDIKMAMETDCMYVDAKFTDFVKWLDGQNRRLRSCQTATSNLQFKNPLNQYPRNCHWCYADYKYMNILFKDHPDVLSEIDWGVFGFSGRNGFQSTLWIGSDGAYTPCHQDSYGFNLVAQITGRKKWTLFPPEESQKLYPTRIPYEESSVFSKVNIKSPNLNLHPKYASIIKIEVILEAGDVLFVPKHWWHFVECLEPSISVNTWIEEVSDDIDRVKEAVTRIIVCSLKDSEGAKDSTWLNPTEEKVSFEESLGYLKKTLALVKPQENINVDTEICTSGDTVTTSGTLTANNLIDCLTSERVMNVIISELIEGRLSKYRPINERTMSQDSVTSFDEAEGECYDCG